MEPTVACRRRTHVLARLATISTLVCAWTGASAAVATADQPAKTPITDSYQLDLPAGTFCDFHYRVTGAFTETITDFGDRTEVHVSVSATHTNVDTGYTVTERDQLNQTISPDAPIKEIGLHWHLRDSSGRLVVVGAGELIFSGDIFDGIVIVKVTPHVRPDTADVICGALGGGPAASAHA